MKAFKLFIILIPLLTFFGCEEKEGKPTFVAVTDIIDVPTTATVDSALTLSGMVIPSNATNKTIVWSVQEAGTTGATVTDGSMLNATAAGVVTVRATIINGTSASSNYLQDFDITVSEESTLQKILDGYVVTAIAFDSKGNAWIGTFGQGLIRYNANETVVYNSENSVLPENFIIRDIAIDKNDNVWIGADGAWKYDGKEFTHYNSQNTAMPQDVVWSIVVDSKNNIWMASCRFQQGGLVKYDGTNWTAYTPDNSPLPANSVKSIAIDKLNNVWLALGDYVNRAYLAKLSNGEWTVYDENDLGFKPYNLGDVQFDSRDRLWGAIDYTLSSSFPLSTHIFIFDGNNTTLLSCGNNVRITPSKITIDNNDYAWCCGVGSVCGVWINEQWMQFDKSEFGGSSVWVIKEDPKRRIWFGTENGIYIRKNT